MTIAAVDNSGLSHAGPSHVAIASRNRAPIRPSRMRAWHVCAPTEPISHYHKCWCSPAMVLGAKRLEPTCKVRPQTRHFSSSHSRRCRFGLSTFFLEGGSGTGAESDRRNHRCRALCQRFQCECRFSEIPGVWGNPKP